jgi:phosphoglycolate phosphatase-like HAD superfamily hydrolase
MKQLCQPKLIFWDFDGVIKDSVEVKTQAFVNLFQSYGSAIAEQVRDHHLANGGMSRFDKIPLYLAWAGESSSPDRVDKYCQQFARSVLQGVIDAPWVAGAESILRKNPYQQVFVLVTATPQEEIEQILIALNLHACFADVYGAPVNKKEAIRATLVARQLSPQQCLMIGDAKADWDAAQVNKVPFLLRRHATNVSVFQNYTGDSVEDFTNI